MVFNELINESNLFKIFYDSSNKNSNIGIENLTNKDIRYYVIDLEENYNVYASNEYINPNSWSLTFPRSNRKKNKCKYVNIYIQCSDNNYVYFCDLDDIHSIKKINMTIDFNYSLPFCFITGSPGGGTSVVVKLLRHLGVHFGDDCGNISIRKPHESISFKFALFSSVENLNKDNLKHNFNQLLNVYNYRQNKVNCVKLPILNKYTIEISDLFTNSKFLSVVREKNNYFSTTEGREFNNTSNIDLMSMQRPLLEGSPIFHLNFDRFFTDYLYVNKVLKFLSVDKKLESNDELDILKNTIDFDSKVLLKNHKV